MPSLGNALQELRRDRSATQLRLEKLNQIIYGIESLNGSGTTGEYKPTEANYIGSFTAENGAGAEGAMGKGERTCEINIGRKDHEFRSCQAHHVGCRSQEDRRRSKSTVGEVPGAAEEGGLKKREPAAAGMRQAFIINARSINANRDEEHHEEGRTCFPAPVLHVRLGWVRSQPCGVCHRCPCQRIEHRPWRQASFGHLDWRERSTNYCVSAPLTRYWYWVTTRRSSSKTSTKRHTIPFKSMSFCSPTRKPEGSRSSGRRSDITSPRIEVQPNLIETTLASCGIIHPAASKNSSRHLRSARPEANGLNPPT